MKEAALARHWEASDANDFEVEHEICREYAVLRNRASGSAVGTTFRRAASSSRTRSGLRSGE
jgi:hypothetical protein